MLRLEIPCRHREQMMKSQPLHEVQGQRSFVVMLDKGDEVRECLQHLTERERLSAAQVSAIGAFMHARLRYFDWDAKQYQPIPLEEQVEVVSLNGDIAEDRSGRPKLHLHAVLAQRDGLAAGGDLESGHVRLTLK
ncbi:PPC domain-containing DNA-binding protein [Dankookia sp. P2]|uniref:PPC domain-containing DNA-binding protein n=1 Tax=Dankookia sp. P2 TaxID=3423955 RepID=UPI003D67D6F2